MRLLDAQIASQLGLSPPRLEVLVDEIPPLSELRFVHDNGVWYAENDGYVRYFSWSGPGNEGGFGGRHYTIKTVDGEQVTLRGPWSSRAGVVNKRGFGPCVDISITDTSDVLERGHTFRSGSISLRAAKWAVDLVGGHHLERRLRFSDDEPYWIVVGNEGAGD